MDTTILLGWRKRRRPNAKRSQSRKQENNMKNLQRKEIMLTTMQNQRNLSLKKQCLRSLRKFLRRNITLSCWLPFQEYHSIAASRNYTEKPSTEQYTFNERRPPCSILLKQMSCTYQKITTKSLPAPLTTTKHCNRSIVHLTIQSSSRGEKRMKGQNVRTSL